MAVDQITLNFSPTSPVALNVIPGIVMYGIHMGALFIIMLLHSGIAFMVPAWTG